jgi:hypothetical protein
MQQTWLRSRRGDDGSVELWVRGWRLEHRAAPILPFLLGIAFLFATSSVGIPIRVAGSLSLLAVAYVCQRLCHTGIRVTPNAVTVVNLRSSVWVPWAEFVGFVGERSGEGGRCVLVRRSLDPVPLSGSLDGEEMNPYGEEGDLSMIDELNFTVERFRKELAAVGAGPPPASPGARRLSAGG